MNYLLILISYSIIGTMQATASPWQVDRLDVTTSYPEGPLVRGEQLLFVDYGGNQVRQVEPDGQAREFWQLLGCGPSGLAPLANGHLVVACYDRNSLVELDALGHFQAEIASDKDGLPFAGPNDLAADAYGGLYFSTSGVFDPAAPIAGKLYYRDARGLVTMIADELHYANGVGLSPDGKTLYVNEHLAGRIVRFPVLAPSLLGDRFVVARLQDLGGASTDPYRGPDGLKVGQDGRLYVCEFGGGRVLIVSPEGQLLNVVQVPAPYVTNVAFGPAGDLYITAVEDPWQAPYPGGVYRAHQD